MNLVDWPIIWPILTLSPTATTGSQGAPMCCCKGITTMDGAGITTMGLPSVASL